MSQAGSNNSKSVINTAEGGNTWGLRCMCVCVRGIKETQVVTKWLVFHFGLEIRHQEALVLSGQPRDSKRRSKARSSSQKHISSWSLSIRVKSM